jgi:hypothetical protein
VPEQFQKQYLKVLLQHPKANSQDKFYPSRTDALMHEIALKMEEPIYLSNLKSLMHTTKKLKSTFLNGSSSESFSRSTVATTATSLLS